MDRRRALLMGKPYTLTNLVQNSGFTGSSGSWPPNWSTNGTSIFVSASDGVMGFNVGGAYGSAQSTMISYTNGHKIYIRGALMKGTSSAVSKLVLLMWYTDSTWYSQELVLNSAVTEREVGSGIYYKLNVGVNNMRFSAQANNTATLYLDSPIIVDLTSAFGSGTEPDQAWCDAHIPYFDGTKTIYV